MRKLGGVQEQILRGLREHNGWRRGGGWVWDNTSRTEKVLNTLANRQLVTKRVDTSRRGIPVTNYYLSEQGLDYLEGVNL